MCCSLPKGNAPGGVQLELQRGALRLAHVLQGVRPAAGAVPACSEVLRREEHHLRHLLAERRRALHSRGEWGRFSSVRVYSAEQSGSSETLQPNSPVLSNGLQQLAITGRKASKLQSFALFCSWCGKLNTQ